MLRKPFPTWKLPFVPVVGFPPGLAARKGSAPLSWSSGPQGEGSVLPEGEGPAQLVPEQVNEERVNSGRERHRSLSAFMTWSFHPQGPKELTGRIQHTRQLPLPNNPHTGDTQFTSQTEGLPEP